MVFCKLYLVYPKDRPRESCVDDTTERECVDECFRAIQALARAEHAVDLHGYKARDQEYDCEEKLVDACDVHSSPTTRGPNRRKTTLLFLVGRMAGNFEASA